jgi:hypothetical protein
MERGRDAGKLSEEKNHRTGIGPSGFPAHCESLGHFGHVIRVPYEILGACRPTDGRTKSGLNEIYIVKRSLPTKISQNCALKILVRTDWPFITGPYVASQNGHLTHPTVPFCPDVSECNGHRGRGGWTLQRKALCKMPNDLNCRSTRVPPPFLMKSKSALHSNNVATLTKHGLKFQRPFPRPTKNHQ